MLVVLLLLVVLAAGGANPHVYAAELAAAAGISRFEPLSSAELDELDGMGGKYLDSLPEGVIEQLAKIGSIPNTTRMITKHDQNSTASISDYAFQNARGVMALIQIAGNHNPVNLHLNLNIFLGNTFYGNLNGGWFDVSGLLSAVESK